MDTEIPHAVPIPVQPLPEITRWQYIAQAINVAGVFVTGTVDPKVLNDTLNWYGSQGWELVSTFDTAGNTGGTRTVVLIFKRPNLG